MVEFTVPPMSSNFFADQTGGLSASDVRMQLDLEFRMQQTTYPYSSDSGPGTIVMAGITVGAIVSYSNPASCPYHIRLKPTFQTIQITQLQITLQSDLAFIYDSLLRLMSSVLLDIFNSEMSTAIFKVVLEAVNGGLEQTVTASFGNGKNNSVLYDLRFINVNIKEQYLEAFQPGQGCFGYVRGSCLGWANQSIAKRPDFETGDSTQYLIEKIVFQSQMELILEHYGIKTAGFTLTGLKASRFVNTGLLLSITAASEDGKQLEATILVQFTARLSGIFTFLDPVVKTIVSCEGECGDVQAIVDEVEKAMQTTMVNYDNQLLTNLFGCRTIYVNDDWVSVSCQM